MSFSRGLISTEVRRSLVTMHAGYDAAIANHCHLSAKLLYCMVEASMNQIVLDFGSKSSSKRSRQPQKQEIQSIIKHAEEAFEILSPEPEWNEYGRLAKKLKNTISQLNIMLRSLK